MERRLEPAGEAASDGPAIPIVEVRRLSEEIRPERPRVILFGAGHVGQAVARAFEPLPFQVDWLASREDLRPEAGGTRATILSEDELEACVLAAPAGGHFVVFTHSHDLDYRLIRAILGKGDFAYAGLIGSGTKRVRFEKRLQAEGVSTERLTCPIGLPGLKSKAPAVIAVALAAQLLQLVEG
ncbi:xanthine dehydrogenase accessory protein XdhC [Phenylobacterium sp. J367]|uniref:xanthine dehydrogenase accessory protein XdhC n=1 Tax=Phenylobacterium sp. J367 TaxID=2898435 RepID=UPI00215177FF|nr:xanthine dehydrogenase accessory protein XdhC [Phenylobacterium sp. J367]MCR5879469.1 xanthine dehydrogenase accessory protein XdhC [Phenylobacterium sp. J367]